MSNERVAPQRFQCFGIAQRREATHTLLSDQDPAHASYAVAVVEQLPEPLSISDGSAAAKYDEGCDRVVQIDGTPNRLVDVILKPDVGFNAVAGHSTKDRSKLPTTTLPAVGIVPTASGWPQ